MPADQPNMEEILSSIRTTLEEETAKVAPGSVADDDVLDLAGMDVEGEPAAPTEELIDLAAFGDFGESRVLPEEEAAKVRAEDLSVNQPDVAVVVEASSTEDLAAEMLGDALPQEPVTEGGEVASVGAPLVSEPAAEGSAEDEFDRLLAELGGDPEKDGSATKDAEAARVAALLDEVDEAKPFVEGPALEAVLDPVVEAVVPALVAGASAPPSFDMPMVAGAEGLQVALPVEVLAAALRPMVQGWLKQNLPAVVERLVKDEIAKLAS